MADIYAFGPDWAIPPTLRERLETLIGETVDTTGAQWWKPALTSTSVLGTITEPGFYPMAGASTAAQLGIPVPSVTPGFLEVTHGYNTSFMMQEFHSCDGTADFRRHMWANSWRPWKPVSASGGGAQLLPQGADLDALRFEKDAGTYRIPNGTDAGTINGVPEPLGMVVKVDWIRGTSGSLVSQTAWTEKGAGWFRNRSASGTSWNPWVRIITATEAPDTGNDLGLRSRMLREDFRRRIGPVSTGGKAAIALRFDHGLKNFAAKILPLLEARGLKATVAMNSRTWDVAENAGVTQATADSWPVEFANHSATHDDPKTTVAVADEVVTGLNELQAQLPKHKIDGWVMPGAASSGQYMGLGIGYRATDFADYYAGRLILGHHAYATGYNLATKNWVLDGRIKQGQYFYEIETKSVQAVKNEIDANIAAGKGLCLMMHPRNLDLTNLISTAMLTEILDYLKQKIDAGQLVSLTVGQMVIASKGEGAAIADSGWRDITAVISPAPTAGRVLIRRSNKNVDLTLDGVTWAGDTGTITRTNLIPAGFQPDAPVTHGATSPHPGSARAFTITSAGAGTFHSLTGGDVLNATTRFTTTQQWPSTLPGAAA